MTLNELKNQRLTDVEVDDGIVKLTFESGCWLKVSFSAMWAGQGDESRISPELHQFLRDMKQRRVAQETRG